MKTRFFLFFLSLCSLSFSASALSYPTIPPPGEMTGGLYRSYFDNIFQNYGSDCSTYGQVIGGFTSTGVPLCVTPVSSGLFLSGQTAGDSIRFNGTDWVRTDLIYNNATNIGIGTQSPGYLLDVAGTGNFLGIRLPTGAASGNVLVSDASGNAYWAASFSGTYAASGITGGTQDYMIKFGPGGNGLSLSQFFDNGTSIGIGTATPSASVKMDIIGDILLNSLRLGRGAGNIISNSVFGWSALGLNISGSMNTAIGYNALGALTAGDGNIGLGNLAGSTFVSGNNNIFIGNNAQPNIGNSSSNQLNIGDWIYGNAGNIGIGAANPGAKLEVNGQIKITGGSPGSGYVLVSDPTGLASWQAGVPASTVDATNITNGTANYIPKFGPGGTGIFASLLYESAGYIGLGNTNPTAELDISGRIRMRTGAGSGLVLVSDGSGTASWAANPPASTVAASGVISGIQGYIPYFGTGGNGLFSSLIFQTGSFLGINTSSPAYTLQVNGTGSFSGFHLPTGAVNGYLLTTDASGNASWSYGFSGNTTSSGITGGAQNYITKFGTGGNGIYPSQVYDSGTGVGIGTAAPGAKLEVNGQVKITGGSPGLNKVLISDATGLASWVNPTGSLSGSFWTLSGNTAGSNDFFGTTNNQDLRFYTNNTQKMVLTSAGRLGIGVTSPTTANLELSGAAIISGDLTVQGKVITDNIVNRTVTNVSISGSLFPDASAPLTYRDIGNDTTQSWNNLYLSGQVKIKGGSPGIGKILTSDATGLATWSSAFSGTVTASGITGGSSGYLSVFGAGGNGLFSSLIFQTGSFLGINTTSPAYTLQVNGTGSFSGFRLPTGAVAGNVLVSDASGNASWQSAAAGVTGGQTNYLARWLSTTTLGTGSITDNGTNVGIGVPTASYKLEVAGTGSFSGFRLPTGAVNNYLLTTDASGNARWAAGFSGATTASGVTGGSGFYIPYFGSGGNGLYNSFLYYTGSRLGINTISPQYMVDIQGSGSILNAASGLCINGTCINAWSGLNNLVRSSGTPNYIAKFDSGGLISNSQIYETGGKLYIGDIPGIIGGAATVGYITIESPGSTNSSNPFLTLSENGGQECRMWITGANKLGSNCTWAAGISGNYTANNILRADSAGLDVTGSTIYQNGNNIGIGTSVASATLAVSGTALVTGDLTVQGKVITDTIVSRTVTNVTVSGGIMPDASAPLAYRNIGSGSQRWNNLFLSGQVSIGGGSPGLGKILTSDATGLATWSSAFSGTVTASGITGGSSGYLSVFGAGGNGLFSSLIFQTGSRIGIGNAAPNSTLDVTGTGEFDGLKLPNGAAAGRYLSTDASGNAFWTGAIASNLNIVGAVTGSTLYYNSGGWNAGTGLYNAGGNIGIGSSSPTAKLTLDSGVTNVSGFQMSRIIATTPVFTGVAAPLGVDGSGNVVIAQQGAIPVYTALGATPNAAINTTTNPPTIGANYDKYFTINARQSFTVTDVGGNPYNCPEFQTGSSNKGATGCSQTPWASYVMTAQNATTGNRYGYQILISDRTDAPFVVRGGMYSSSTGTIMNTAMTIPALWFKAITVPTNRSDWFYINPGVDQNNNVISGGGNIGIGTMSPQSKLEIFTGSINMLHFRGTDNVGLGLSALDTAVSGARNSAFGAYALDSITSGGGNTSLGFRAGNNITTGSNNIMIGSGATARSAGGSNQLNIGNWIYGTGGYIGIGVSSPTSMFEVWSGATANSSMLHFRGANNTALGYGAVKSNQTGNANTGIGAESLYNLTSGYSNTAIGYKSMRSTLAGFNNTAFGQEALFNNGGGSWNAADGYQALYSNSSGTGNTALGAQSLYNLSTGNANTAVGFQALRVIAGSSVGNNTALGYQALYNATTSNLTAIGYQALYSNSSGTGNTAIGYMSLDSVSTGFNNTALGYNTLVNATGNQNIAIGANAGSNLTSGSNNIIIGADKQAVVSTGSNQLNIGDWIYGNGGNVGIGTSTVTAKLDVNGTFKLGSAGMVTTAAGTCTIASTAITTTATAYTCTGVPASTAVAVTCSAAAAFTTPGTTALYCRANGGANSVTCNTTVANSVATTYTCMWMKP